MSKINTYKTRVRLFNFIPIPSSFLKSLLLGGLLGIIPASKAQVTETIDFEGLPQYTTWQSDANYPWTEVQTGTSPTCSPHGGIWMAEFESYYASSGTTAQIITPAFDLSQRPGGTAAATLSFWIYRDNSWSSSSDRVTAFINDTPDTTNTPTRLTMTPSGQQILHRSCTLTPTGTVTDGWYQYTFTIPSGSLATNYIIIMATSDYGSNIFIDDVQYTSYPALAQRQPFGMYWGYERSAAIYTPGTFGKVKDLKWTINSLTAACTGNVKIYLKQTTAGTFASADTWTNLISGATLVYDATPTFSTGINTFNLNTPNFDYTANNLMVLVETNYGNTGGENYDSKKVVYTSAANTHEKWYQDNSPPTGTGYIDGNRPGVSFTVYSPPTLNLSAPSDLSYLATNGSYTWSWTSAGTPVPTNTLVIEGTTKYTGTANSSIQATGSGNPTSNSYTWSVTSDNTYSPSASAFRTFYRYKTITPTTVYQTESFSLPSASSSFFYQVNMTAGNNYIFATCNHDHGKGAAGGSSTYDSKIEIFNSSFVTQANNDNCPSSATLSYLDYQCTTSGTYYVKVYGVGAAFGNFIMGYKKYTSVSEPNGIWKGTTSTDWLTGTNWSNNTVPTENIDAYIPDVSGTTNRFPSIGSGGLSVNCTTTATRCKSLNIASGARLYCGSSLAVDVHGQIIINGVFNQNPGASENIFQINTGGKVTVNSGGYLNIGSQNLSGTTSGTPAGIIQSTSDIQINGGELLINGGNVFIEDGLTHTSGTFTMNSGHFYIEYYGGGTNIGWDGYAASIINVTGGTVHVCGQKTASKMIDWSISQSHTWTAGTMSLELKGGAGTNIDGSCDFAGKSVYNLIINRAGFTTFMATVAGNGLNVANDLTLTAGNFDGGSYTINVGGNWTNNSASTAFACNTSSVVFTGGTTTSYKDINGTASTRFYNLTFNTGSFYNINPLTYVRADHYFTHNSGAALNILSGKNLDLYSTSVFNGDITSVGAYNSSIPASDDGREIDLNSGSDFSGSGSINADLRIYDNTSTLTSNFILKGNFIINNPGTAAVFAMSSHTFTVYGNWTNNGTFTCGTGTIALSGNAKNINGANATTFYNLIFPLNSQYTINPVSSSPTYTTGAFTVEGNSQSASNATVTLATGKILGLNGTAINTVNGLLKSVDVFDGTRDIGMNGNPGYLQGGGIINADLQISSNKTILGSDFDLDGNFIIASGSTFEMNASNPNDLLLSGNWTNSGTLNRGIGTVIFDGTVDRTIDAGCSRGYTTNATKDFYNVKINCTAGKKVGLINTALTIRNNLDIISGSLSTDNGLCATNGLPFTNEYIGPTTYINQVLFVKGNTAIYTGANLYIGYQCVGNRTDEGLDYAPPLQTTNVPEFEHNLSVFGTITTNRPVVSGYADIFVRGSKITGEGDVNEFGVDIQPVDGYTAVQIGPVDIQGDLIIQAAAGNTWQCTTNNNLTIRGNLYIYRNFDHNGTVNLYGNMTNGSYASDNPTISTSIFNFYHRSTGSRYIRMTNPITFGYFNVKNTSAIDIRQLQQHIIVLNDFNIEASRILDANNYNITLAGNWTNSGTFSPNGTDETVTFNGAAAQNMNGSNATTFNNLTVFNTSSTGVTFGNSGTVASKLTLTDGYVYTTASNLITLNDQAYVNNYDDASAGSNASFIDGPIKKIGRNKVGAYTSDYTFCFPTGKNGKWAPVTLVHFSGTTTISDAFTAEYYKAGYGNYTVSSPLNHVSTKEWWNISKESGNSNLTKRIWLYSKDLVFSVINDISDANLVVAHWNGSSWEDCKRLGNGGDYVKSDNWSTFSPFTFASKSSANPLPIELLSFNAKLRDTVVDIFWSTASEMNSDFFTVERSSDGINFVPVNTQTAAGVSNALLNYFDIDHNPLKGLSYYRLKETDFDGSFQYSDLVPVYYNPVSDVSQISQVSIFPNPSNDNINVVFSHNIQGPIYLQIFDIAGKLVYRENLTNITTGTNSIKIDITNFKNGIYFLQLLTSGTKIQNKFIKVE